MFLKQFQSTFEPLWTKWINQCLAEVQTISTDSAIKEILKETATILTSKGKYIRPALAHLIARAYTPNRGQDMRPGFFIEAFHLFALIHDDIIDKGTLRRSAPTIHTALASTYNIEKRIGDRQHLANAQAILAGDLVYTWALELLQELHQEPYGKELSDHLFAMIKETVLGQMIDVDLMSQRHTTDERLYDKMYFKTASYTFIRPMQIGVIVGGGDAQALQSCVAIGKPMGLGFQIQDDLIDVLSTSAESGKKAFTDIFEGQHTYITHYIRTQGTKTEIDLLESAINNQSVDEPLFREMIMTSGAVGYCQTKVNIYFQETQTAITNSPLPQEAKEGLQELLTFLQQRKK